MTTEVADAIIKRLESGQIEGVSFFGGEPLFNWDIIEYIVSNTTLPEKYRNGRFWNVTTNGTLVTPERMQFMKDNKFHVNLSFDGTKPTQDKWRGNSYDAVIKNLYLFLTYPSLQVLKTLSDVDTLYDDIKHIKDLGFKAVFINMLEAYGHETHEHVDPEFFKAQYRRVIKDLHDPPNFTVGDFQRWTDLLKKNRQSTGCGFTNRGLGVSWNGDLYPCHEGPSLPKEFVIGNIFDWIDPVAEKRVRGVPNAYSCEQCDYKLTKCYVSMYHKHGEMGADPPMWAKRMEWAKLDVIEEMNPDIIKRVRLCANECKTCDTGCGTEKEGSLLVATLFSIDKYLVIKPFFESLSKLQVPHNTDMVFIVDDSDMRSRILLRRAIVGGAKYLPPLNQFRNIKILSIPTVHLESYMYRIARGRNLAMGLARESYDALFFLDADVLMQPDGLRKLLEVDTADIVGALVKCRRTDKEGWYNIYRRKEGGMETITEWDIPIIPIDATGHDCILIHKTCFDENYYYKPEIPEAEDMGFCFRNKDKGRTIVINTNVITKHIDYGDILVRDTT